MFYETLYVHDAKAAALQPIPYRAAPAKSASRSNNNNNNNNILRIPKPQAQRPKPFDPDDLTRRLHVVLAEQKAHAERKKRARAALDAERQANAAAVARNASALHPGQRGIPMGPTAPSTQIQKKEATASKSLIPTAPRDAGQDAPKTKTERLHRAGLRNSTSSSSNRNSEDTPPSNYRHIPQVAASQFARTTTTETVTEKHLVHKLSRQAIKSHVQGPNAAAGRASDFVPAEQTKALRRAQSMRERQYERNQFQQPHILAATAEVDERPATTAPHNFKEYLHHKSLDALDEPSKEMRRRSMGAILGMMISRDAETAELSHTSSENYSAANHSDTGPANPDEHRVDWTQSDEAAILRQQKQQQQQQQQQLHSQQPQQSQKSAAGPNVLRKSESKWALRTKLGGFTKKADKLSSPTEEKDAESLAERPKSPTKSGGLFARFKR
ncbi:uncharacterized protein TRIREDRAFT_108157 [Trichoderma reesei QM6a]|jgi:hypothetical protein|uniref:Predicted protein n=2 Tax=Hypocrea jecorina TaxID=51453 RepID=G0RLP7_HYPJQ|nr:uncharacterized protein TRIREDRAFT_108157 [Trichoderma reesei QM6a]EGR47915.1 predicted protein [Trichoderma reesei QM6a]ETS02071.1 hypothetical protein M419DRAFT_78685 [Trichoderma reesei RUT C-30]